VVPMVAAALLTAVSCSSPAPLTGLAAGCEINSDCGGSFICAYGRCHQQCKTSKDCNGATCLAPNGVCELSQEATCSNTLPCVSGLTCAETVCRASCTPGVASGTTGGCLGTQSCVAGATSAQSVCVDVAADAGASTSDSGKPPHDAGTRDSTVADASGDTSRADRVDSPAAAKGDGGAFAFTPSNFSLAAVDAGELGGDGGGWANAPDVTITGADDCGTSTDCNGQFSPSARTTVTQSDGNLADLFILKSLTIIDTASLSFSGPNPVILAVLTTVSIQGTLYLGDGEAGGFGESVPGPGAGLGLGVGYATSSGGGGASYCGLGGAGGYSTAPVPAAGPTYGTATLVPLLAGSHGAGSAGAGGGAIQIVAGQSITVGPLAHVNAAGQGGNDYSGGGGSGGAILLEAPSVVIHGVLAANGGGGGAYHGSNPGTDGSASASPAPGGSDTLLDGGTAAGGAGSGGTSVNGVNGGPPDPGSGNVGGGGGGGAGRIRINTATGSATITGVVSPDLSTPCATQGLLGK